MSTQEHMIEIGGETFNLYKTGGDQARQLTKILKWLGRYATPVVVAFSNEEGVIKFDNVFDLIMKVSEVLDDEALLQAFQIILGCNEDFANKHFDIMLLVELIESLFENETYRGLIDRFFGTRSSEPISE